jgi:hypothetical protein
MVIKLLVLVAMLPLATLLKAQSFYGSVVGTVTDSSDAVVPGATVTATNLGTSEAIKVQTDSGGKYSFVNLVPADYSVVVEKANFKRFVREHVPVQVGATIRIDAALAVGAISDTVTVTTAVPLLQTDSSTLGQEVEGAQVQQMPLNGRNVLNLIALAPGVVPTGAAMGDTGLNQGTRTAGGAGWGNYEIGGSIQGQSGQYVDGVANNLLGGNIIALVPTQDAIQEFNVASSNAGADFGRFSGGVVNMTTKSGTNAFHGGVWEYFRNRVLNANDYFSNLIGSARPFYNQDQYGAAINGPIKRDKAFFMFTWEDFRNLTGNLTPTIVPTAALQNGVFNTATTAPVDPSGNCNIVPYTGQTVNGQQFASGGYYIQNLYQAGLVSGTCGDPTMEVIKTFYPAPNQATLVNGSNWLLTTPLANQQNQYNGRIDYNLSEKQRIFGRYTYWTVADNGHSEFLDRGFPAVGSTTPTKWPTNDGHAAYKTHQAVVGDTLTLNSSTVVDVRVNYVRQFAPNLAQSTSVNESAFGTYFGDLASQMDVHVQPGFQANGGHSFYNMNNYPNDGITTYNTYGISANLVKILGSHSFKFGTELRLMDQSGVSYNGGGSGSLQFGTQFTGDEWASVLMGYPTGVTFKSAAETAAYTYYQGYYVTDNWQAARNLTLNLGLRYELPGAIAERNNKAVVLLPKTTDPITGVTGTEALVASSLYGDRTTVVPQRDLFAPRVGFAYRATADTVIRGGYGISYLPNDLSGVTPGNAYINGATTTANIPGSSPGVQLQGILACMAGQATSTAAAAICSSNSIPTTGILPPGGRGNGQATYFMPNLVSATSYKGQNIQAPYPYQSYPYTQQWNIAASHQFKGDWMAEVSYNGLSGSNLPGIGRNLDQLQDGTYNSSGVVTSGALAGDSLTAKSVGGTPFQCPNTPGFQPGSISVGQCIRPNPYYNNVADSAEFYAVQRYRAVTARAEKRMGAYGVLAGNYTWAQSRGNTDTQASYLESKATTQGGNGDGGIQDYDNLGGEISLISFDVTNRTIISYVENLPFGKGQKYANSVSGIGDALVSGWAVNGITTFQSGFPVFYYMSSNNQLNSSFGAGTTRPNVVAGCNKVIGGSGLARAQAGGWFNTSCFASPGNFAFGNEPRVDSQVRGDGIKNFDFSLQKSTPIHESANFEFRAEFFNIFNRVQFAPPIPSVGASNFGQVTYQVNKPRQVQLSARVNF